MSPKSEGDSRLIYILIAAAFVIYLLWKFVIPPVIIWIQQSISWIQMNWVLIVIILATICILFIVGLILYFRREESKEREIAASQIANAESARLYEELQRAQGLGKFVRSNGTEYWGTPEQRISWQTEEDRDTLKYKIKNEIDLFEPASNFGGERLYHVALYHWLQHKFPTAKYESLTGASRPDIVIDDVAIEIKGPTDSPALHDIAFKCVKYLALGQYNHLIVVLFDPTYTQKNFDEFQTGINQRFPDCQIIEKKRK